MNLTASFSDIEKVDFIEEVELAKSQLLKNSLKRKITLPTSKQEDSKEIEQFR